MIDPSRPSAGYPLTPLQHGMLFQTLVAPRAGVNVEQVVCTLHEAVDAERMRAAWQILARRHEVLRTVFRWTDVSEPLQEVRDAAEIPWDVRDHAGDPPAKRAARLKAFLDEDRARGFDLSATPPLRGTLFRHGAAEHVLVWSFHHVLLDGRSVTLLLREFFALYDGGANTRLPAPRPFREHVAWLQARPAEADAAFWARMLDGFAGPTPLPVRRRTPRDPAVEPAWGEREARLSDDETAALRAFETREGIWLSTLVAGAWAVVLGRHADAAEAVFGVVRGGRVAEGAEDTVGMLVNTVPFRVALPARATVIDWLDDVGDRATALAAHEHASPADIARWGGQAAGTPLFHALLDFQPRGFDAPFRALDGLWKGRDFRIHRRPGAPLALAVTGDSPIRIRLAYDADRFDDTTVDELLRAFRCVLQALAANPHACLGDVGWMDESERRRVVVEWNDTAAEYPREAGIATLFAQQAARTPHAVAVVFGGETLTYRALDAEANRVARWLRARGVGLESRVAVCLERGPRLVAALVGILKAGAAYVPLDPGYPVERLAFMLRDAGVAALLTENALAERIPPAPGVPVVRLDAEADALAAESAEPVDGGAEADNLAYVIYTSGSTGTPKGVAVEQRSVARLVRGADYAALGPDEVMLAAAPVSFDASTLELWGALLNGAQLVLIPGATPSLEELGSAITRHGVTTLWLTAGLFQVMVQERLEDFAGVRQLLAGGDVLPVEQVRRIRERFPRLRLINGYGPTENTTFTCCHTVDARWSGGPVPIGTPIHNTRVYVLDVALRPVPPGVPGELFAGGDGVARGYLNRPALTAERFIPDPFSATPGARLYRTGDRVRWTADGTLEYLGRLDTQAKIRGFRIEPGEVEAALRALPGVAECVVVVREEAPGEARLVAYLTGEADPATLRALLRERLPAWMVPAAFVSLHRLPLNANGKVDRASLPPPHAASLEAYVAPRTAVEARLAEIWAAVLGCERIGIRDHFQEVGGHSLVATRVVARIRDVLDGEVTVATLAERPTIEALAALLSERAAPRQAPVDLESSPDHLLALMDDLSDEEIDRLLAAHADVGLPE